MEINVRQLVLFCICIACVIAYYIIKYVKKRRAIRLQKEKDALKDECIEAEAEEAEDEP